MTILAIIAIGIYENTTQSYSIRDSIEREGDFYSGVRVAFDVLGRDLSQVYTPQLSALPSLLGKQQPTTDVGSGQYAAPLAPATNFWAEPLNTKGVRPSRFTGDSAKVTFVASSHVRLFREATESDFAKITYELIDGTNRPEDTPSKILIKKEDPAVFEETETPETATKYVILTGIKNLSIRYLDGEKDQWDTSWDNAGMVHKGAFPALIEVTIEVNIPDTQNQGTLKLTQVFRPELTP